MVLSSPNNLSPSLQSTRQHTQSPNSNCGIYISLIPTIILRGNCVGCIKYYLHMKSMWCHVISSSRAPQRPPPAPQPHQNESVTIISIPDNNSNNNNNGDSNCDGAHAHHHDHDHNHDQHHHQRCKHQLAPISAARGL